MDRSNGGRPATWEALRGSCSAPGPSQGVVGLAGAGEHRRATRCGDTRPGAGHPTHRPRASIRYRCGRSHGWPTVTAGLGGLNNTPITASAAATAPTLRNPGPSRPTGAQSAARDVSADSIVRRLFAISMTSAFVREDDRQVCRQPRDGGHRGARPRHLRPAHRDLRQFRDS